MNRFLKSFLRKIVVILPLLYIAFYFKEYMSSMDGKISGDKIIINEVVSNNFSGFTDEEGKYADWIEIYNPTKTDIDLGDYSIGKKRNGDKSCRLPSVILKSGEYLVVFADGKNYVSDVIHLSFSLDKSGETLYLFMGDEIKDSFCFPELNTDESFGRRYFSTIETGVFAFATPGKSNPDFFKRRRREENIGNIYFSQGGGNYQEEFQLQLETDNENAIILYTLDCSEPTQENALVYNEPIMITSMENEKNRYVNQRCIPATSVNPEFSNFYYDYGTNNVYKGVVVKARLYEEGILSEDVWTETFFIDADYTMPVVSISANPEELFGNDAGIYVCGSVYYTASRLNLEEGIGNYDLGKSIDAHIEMWGVNAEQSVFDSDIKLSMGGGYSLMYNLQKAFNVDIQGDNIELPLFGEKENRFSYGSFSLKSMGGGEALENCYQKHLLNNMLVPLNIGTKMEDFCILFLNGEYWGIYSIVEPKKEEYYREHFGISNIEYYHNGQEASNENFSEELDELSQKLYKSDLTDEEQYQWVEEIIDVENFIQFIASDIYRKL